MAENNQARRIAFTVIVTASPAFRRALSGRQRWRLMQVFKKQINAALARPRGRFIADDKAHRSIRIGGEIL